MLVDLEKLWYDKADKLRHFTWHLALYALNKVLRKTILEANPDKQNIKSWVGFSNPNIPLHKFTAVDESHPVSNHQSLMVGKWMGFINR
jgi:hypothetical protein